MVVSLCHTQRPQGSPLRCASALALVLTAFFLSGFVAAGVEVALAFASASGYLSQSADLHRALQVGGGASQGTMKKQGQGL